uniref:Uncharacterized protein n=1 Tax=Trichobilharzia regenti TaxID=157069 RepID=A0AA85IUR4_TRIRE|nr:unnamed protein product [Trichobilharzia regenti]
MNTITFVALFVCLFLAEISSGPHRVSAAPNPKPHPKKAAAPAKPAAAPAKPAVAPAKPVQTTPQPQESFFPRMWHKVTSLFKSSSSSSSSLTQPNGNENLSFKDKITNTFNNWFGVEEYNPSKDSEFLDRLWLLFRHCFLNMKNLAKILSI